MGYLSIDRKLFSHWIWKTNEPFDKRSAWIDLIQMATYTEHKGQNYKGEFTVIKRGEIHTSMLYLSKRWKWDRRKVKRFLDGMAVDGMLSFHSTTNGTTGGTIITLENYTKYQGERTTDGMYQGTTDVQPMYNEGTYQNKRRTKDIKKVIDNTRAEMIPGWTLEEKLAAWRGGSK